MTQPLVSVLMPAYNHEQWVEAAVRSVFAQTYDNVELVAIDDGSTDATASILQTLAQDAPVRMSVRSRPNQGVCRTLNECFSVSSGALIAHLASDDLLDARFIERVVAHASESDFKTVLHTDADTVIGGDRITRRAPARPPAQGDAFMDIAAGRCRIVSSSVVSPRWLWAEAGPYDETLVAEDFDMHLRQARHAHFEHIPEALFCIRKVPGSLGQRPDRWIEDLFVALEKHRDMFSPDEYRELRVNRRVRAASVCGEHAQLQAAFGQCKEAVSLGHGAMQKAEIGLCLVRRVPVAVARGAVVRRVPGSLRRWLKR